MRVSRKRSGGGYAPEFGVGMTFAFMNGTFPFMFIGVTLGLLAAWLPTAAWPTGGFAAAGMRVVSANVQAAS